MKETNSIPPYIITATEILKLGIEKIPMLIDNLLQKVGMASLSGGSDGGKSFLCLYLALKICSTETEIFNLKIEKKHGSVIIVCTEDTAEDICVRLTSLLKRVEIDPNKMRFIFDTPNLITKLKDELTRQPADLVVIDTLGDLFNGNLNDSITVRQFLKPYRNLAQEKKCLFLFNHHIGKGKESNVAPSKNDILGSQGIESSCRTVLMLKKRGDGKRVLTVVKGNHISDEFKDKGLVLNFDIENGFETTGEMVSYTDNSNTTGGDKNLVQEVLTLYPSLKSYQKVVMALKEKGYNKIDKNKVGKIWKENQPSGTTPIENDGRTEK